MLKPNICLSLFVTSRQGEADEKEFRIHTIALYSTGQICASHPGSRAARASSGTSWTFIRVRIEGQTKIMRQQCLFKTENRLKEFNARAAVSVFTSLLYLLLIQYVVLL